jgi:PAS domain S-box-containing protein
MKDPKVVSELEEKILSWQAAKPEDSLIRKFRENPKFSPMDIQNLIEELTLRRVEAAELRQIRLELEESRHQYEELFEFHPDGFLVLNDSNFIKATNLAFANEFGQKREKLIGLDFLSFVNQDSQEGFNLFLNSLFQSRLKRSCEILLQKKADDTLPAVLTGRVRKDSNGQFEVLIVVSKNQNTCGNGENPLVIVDMEGRLTYVNSALCRATGYSHKDLLNRSFADFLFEDDRYRVMARLLQARMAIPVTPQLEFRVICKNQNNLRFHTSPRPINPGGQTQGFVAVLHQTPEGVQSIKRIESKQGVLQGPG